MKKKELSPIAWVFSQAGEKKTHFILSVITAILGVICQTLPFLIAGQIMTLLVNGETKQSTYLSLFGYMALCFIGKAVFHSVSTSLSHGATFEILGNIRKRGLDHLAEMPLGDVLSHSAGELKNILVERVDSMETTLAHIIPEFTANIIAPVCILIILFFTDWRMAIASLITLPLGMLCYMGMMIGYEDNYGRTVKATKNLNDIAVEYIGGIQVIKAFSKVGSSYARFVSAANENASSYIDWMRKAIVFFTFGMSIMPTTLLVVLPVGGFFLMRGTLSVPTFLYCIILSVALLGPVITCMSYTDDLAVLKTVASEIRNIIEAPVMERPETADQTIRNHDISLHDVHFAYQEKEVLHGINMEIPEGSYVALVGPSGSGKSTIARLIDALWDVNKGSIRLGGVNIREIPLAQYADYIAYVSQDNYLFNQTIRENIRMGKTVGAPATDEEVEEAARKSGCYDFIMGLEHGFDTIVGSAGGHLSGGERQRISIARAMLKDAPIIILDEATAYTDPENESIIQQSIAKLIEGKTLIVIAHRLSTIMDADRIYVIHNGLIEEQGTHAELLSAHGLYEKMWKSHISVNEQQEGETVYA
ncbi:MAG: ABC transporter ATP-binding protein [Lachnospiraceae bacterium]|nr:ABC transporter ATP-binding protein [Lachnospiraceae bacterium]